MKVKKDSFSWKQRLIVLALMIVTVSFVFTGVYLALDEPDYEDHCFDKRAIPIVIQSFEECEEYGGEWVDNAYCDLYSECSSAYETANSEFRFKVFISSFIIGALILVSAIFIPIPIISLSMMSSGIVTLLISVVGYWEEMGEWFRFLILGVTLVALIYIAVKKFSK